MDASNWALLPCTPTLLQVARKPHSMSSAAKPSSEMENTAVPLNVPSPTPTCLKPMTPTLCAFVAKKELPVERIGVMVLYQARVLVVQAGRGIRRCHHERSRRYNRGQQGSPQRGLRPQ
mmetsp:Transcript_12627/g.34013  ORF Transcript_12627/g.34013 Transcript_12627/m.34013 type:complete len:119 (+) Transcript_12627:1204-1560(+)